MIHYLKVWPTYYERLADGTKTFEIRKDDRGYQAGDALVLQEWDPRQGPIGGYTGREIRRTVGFIFKQGFGCDLGEYVVMSLLPETASE